MAFFKALFQLKKQYFSRMNRADKTDLRVAILDMYEGTDNQGMRCLRELLDQFRQNIQQPLVVNEYNVRLQAQLPSTDYDIYLSSGGPGSPLADEDSIWEAKYFQWIEQVLAYNEHPQHVQKKKVFFICHSFQLACRFFDIGQVTKRKSTAFGVFPVHFIQTEQSEKVFQGMSDPFYAVDSRDYQVIQPNHDQIKSLGSQLLAIEKARPHVPYERAIMAVRFNEHMIGTQFHPEADAIGMLKHLHTPEKKKTVIENYGEEKWQSMVAHLNDPDKIMYTYSHIIPNFLQLAVEEMISIEA